MQASFASQSRSKRELSAGGSDTSDASSAALTQSTNTTTTSTDPSTQSSWTPSLVNTYSDMQESKSTMPLDNLLSAMRTRDTSLDLLELTSTHTFKITEDEFDGALFDRVVTMGVCGAEAQTQGPLFADTAERRGKLSVGGFTQAPCKASGDVFVGDSVAYPSLVWRGGDWEPIAILHVITAGDILESDLLQEAAAANPTIITMIIVEISDPSVDDKTATIESWQRGDDGHFHSTSVGGVFRDKDGKAMPCEFEIPLSDLLPLAKRNDKINGLTISLDMKSLSQRLTAAELADVAMRAQFWATPFDADISPLQQQPDAVTETISPTNMEVDE
ncbi:hypothetical protein LTR56_021642 [Elasticomyces elasticus]|nr:hypothetical protein LTR56_021642 [Elasticomyces elasticus]KAK3623510.1 hypothetical protein LTR22_024360 [Elasticomyces elasticus]KAK4920365.1 hypothetical protein LTR49_012147 [Elasticomyces elasticus]KAK5759024.1 hypothetical protein LTS12_010796 [Elasticomyces elasticus]